MKAKRTRHAVYRGSPRRERPAEEQIQRMLNGLDGYRTAIELLDDVSTIEAEKRAVLAEELGEAVQFFVQFQAQLAPPCKPLPFVGREPRRKGAALWISHIAERYADSQNPLEAWFAYVVARGHGLPIPSWVLEYLDRAAKGLLQFRDRKCDVVFDARPAFVAKQFGFEPHARGQRTDEFDVWPSSAAHELASKLKWLRRHRDTRHLTHGKLCDRVAEENNVSRSVVDRAWTAYLKAYGEEVEFFDALFGRPRRRRQK